MKKIKKTIKGILISSAFLPIITMAGTTENPQNLKELLSIATQYLQYAIMFIISLSILMFIYNVFQYFIAKGDDVGSKKDAGLYVMYSVIGFFLMLSLWGLVYVLKNTFKLDNTMPTFPFGVFNSSGSNGSGGTNPFTAPPGMTNK